jgi:hypothetical protein
MAFSCIVTIPSVFLLQGPLLYLDSYIYILVLSQINGHSTVLNPFSSSSQREALFQLPESEKILTARYDLNDLTFTAYLTNYLYIIEIVEFL